MKTFKIGEVLDLPRFLSR